MTTSLRNTRKLKRLRDSKMFTFRVHSSRAIKHTLRKHTHQFGFTQECTRNAQFFTWREELPVKNSPLLGREEPESDLSPPYRDRMFVSRAQ